MALSDEDVLELMAAGKPEKGYWGQVAENLYPSAEQYVRDLVTPITQPRETLEALQNLGSGVAQKLAAGDNPNAVYANPQGVQMADAVGDFYADRYGSLDKAKQTFREDPVGVLGDATGLLSLGSGALTSTGRIGSMATRAGSKANRAFAGLKDAAETVANVGGRLDPTTLVMQPLQAIPTKGLYKHGLATLAGNKLDADLLNKAADYGLKHRVRLTNSGTRGSSMGDLLRRGTAAEGGNIRLKRKVGETLDARRGVVNEIPDIRVEDLYTRVDDLVARHGAAKAGSAGVNAEKAKMLREAGQSRVDFLVEHPDGMIPADKVDQFKTARANAARDSYKARGFDPDASIVEQSNQAMADAARDALRRASPRADRLDAINQDLHAMRGLQEAIDPAAVREAAVAGGMGIQHGPRVAASASGASPAAAAATGWLASKASSELSDVALIIRYLREGQITPAVAKGLLVQAGRTEQTDEYLRELEELARENR